jgi:anti-sigma factor RsiW
MNCPDILELQSLIDRQLPPDRQQAVETHLAACPACAAQANALRTMAEALRAHITTVVVPDALPKGLQERLLRAVATAPPVRHLSCRKVLPQLTAYLDGELSDADAAAIEAHSFTCEKCFTALSELRAVTETLAARQRAVPSEQLLGRIMAALRREAVQARSPQRRWLGRVAWQPLAAGLAAAVVLAAVIFPHFSSTPSLQPPIAPDGAVAGLPAPEAPVPTAQPTPSAGVAVGQPSSLGRLAGVFPGRRAGEDTSSAGSRSGGAGGTSAPTWVPSAPAGPQPTLHAPAGGPVVAFADSAMPSVSPVAISTDRRVASLPTKPGLVEGDEQPRARVTPAGVPTDKPRPTDIALASRPAPTPAPEPELVPRRSARPAWEIYRSEGVDRERLALAAERLNERVPRVRMANAKNIVIIH